MERMNFPQDASLEPKSRPAFFPVRWRVIAELSKKWENFHDRGCVEIDVRA